MSYRRSPRRDRCEPTYPVEDGAIQMARDGDLRQLERDVSRMPYHLRTDLDQLVPQRRQCPVLHARWQRDPPQEVAQVVRQDVKLQPRTWLASKLEHDSRVQRTACFPSLIHCSAVPRWL